VISPAARRAFIVLNVVNGVGDGFLLPTMVLYFVGHVGLSGGSVALGLSLSGMAAALLLTPLARLAERIGLKTTMVAGYIVQAVAVGAFILVTAWWTFILLLAASSSAAAATIAVRQALISVYAGPDDRVRVSASNRAAYNASFAIGAVVAGFVVTLNSGPAYRALILADAVSFLLSAVVTAALPAVARKPSVSRIRWRILTEDRSLIYVAGLIGVLFLYGDLIAVGLPLLTVGGHDLPKWVIPAAFLLNTVMTVALQVRLSKGAADVRSASLIGARAGGLLLIGSALVGVAAWGTSWPVLPVVFAGVAVLTLGELWASTATWGLSYGLSPTGRADQIGLFSMGGILMRTVSPSLVAASVLNLGYFGWVLIGLLMGVAGLMLIPATAAAAERTHRYVLKASTH
jgi:MFS family permease